MISLPILPILIVLPLIGLVFIFFSSEDDENAEQSKKSALWTSASNFFLSLYLPINRHLDAPPKLPLISQTPTPYMAHGGCVRIILLAC